MVEARNGEATEAWDPVVQIGLTWMAEHRHNMAYAAAHPFLPILPGVRNPNTLIAEAKPSPSMEVTGSHRSAQSFELVAVGRSMQRGLDETYVAAPRKTEKVAVRDLCPQG